MTELPNVEHYTEKGLLRAYQYRDKLLVEAVELAVETLQRHNHATVPIDPDRLNGMIGSLEEVVRGLRRDGRNAMYYRKEDE